MCFGSRLTFFFSCGCLVVSEFVEEIQSEYEDYEDYAAYEEYSEEQYYEDAELSEE